MAAHTQPNHSSASSFIHRLAVASARVLPAILLAAGIVGGAWISAIMELEFLRPLFIGMALICAALVAN